MTSQEGINKVGYWVYANHLKLSSKICKFMVVSRCKSKASQVPTLTLYAHQLERVYEYKYLGVTLTCNLLWSTHVNNMVNKTRKLTGMLYQQFHW